MGLLKGSIEILELFSLAFMKPTDEWAKELEELLERVKSEWPDVELILDDPSLMNQEYVRLFRFGGQVPCPPYESFYRTEDKVLMSDYAVDVQSRMRAFGVEVSDDFKDLPEHISVELEYLRYLYVLGEDEALEEAASFLEDHLLQWVPEFCECVRENSRVPFYRDICAILPRFLLKEYGRLKQGKG